jgi:hypothetical protein
LLLAGCASTPKPTPTDPALLELNAQAAHIRKTMDQLAATWQAGVERPEIYPIPTSGKLAKPISLVWYGGLEKAVRSVADLVGYGYQTEGRAPATPIVVGVDANKKPAFSVLQDIGVQAGSTVSVVVRPSKHLIAVVYLGRS